MGLISFLIELFGGKRKRNRRRGKKRSRVTKCNAVRFTIGSSISDSGLSDYDIFYKVKRGKVSKRILKRPKKGSDDRFYHIELKPKTDSAYVVILRQSITSHPTRGRVMYKVALFKPKGRRPKIVKLGT